MRSGLTKIFFLLTTHYHRHRRPYAHRNENRRTESHIAEVVGVVTELGLRAHPMPGRNARLSDHRNSGRLTLRVLKHAGVAERFAS